MDRLSRARKKIKYYLWVLGILALGIIGYGLYGMLYMRKQEACIGKMTGVLAISFLVFGILFFLLFKSYNESGKRLEQLAFSDEITGGINKMEFAMRYQELCRKQKADQYALVFMDSVDFKQINETLGKQNGDKMLRYFYTVIEKFLDKEEYEFAARTEMDHFFLCLKEREPQKLQKRMEKIIREINSFQYTDLPRYRVKFRLGVSFVKDNGTDITVIQDQTRAALKSQTAKEAGKCAFYNCEVAQKQQREREMNNRFVQALADEEFQVYLQPKVSLQQRKIKGAEALVRWDYPGRGILPPSEFIPLLENSGKIQALEKYIFERVCRWLKQREGEKKKLYPVSVNLSRSHFAREDFMEDFIRIADDYRVDKSLLEFEVTETLFLEHAHLSRVEEGIRIMHEQGFLCSLDDFGSGYSSFTMLKDFDIDVLKLDRSFFLDLHSEKARSIIACIQELAESLHIKTVAEGIETQEQLAYVNSMHCDVIQGFYFSRPLPLKEFETWADTFVFPDFEINMCGGGKSLQLNRAAAFCSKLCFFLKL